MEIFRKLYGLDKLNNPNLNYLMRYLKLGGGIIPDIPNYFK